MTGQLAPLRRVALLLAAVATFAMHTGLAGACTGSAAGTHAITASAAMAQGSDTGHPDMPLGNQHGINQLCQARVPATPPGAPGTPAVLAMTAPTTATATLGDSLRLAAPPRGQPPGRSSLCVWRI